MSGARCESDGLEVIPIINFEPNLVNEVLPTLLEGI